MLRPRHESLYSDGITDQKSLQRTSATKSANKRHWRGLMMRSFKATAQPIFEGLRFARTILSPGITFRDAEPIKDGDDSFSLLTAQFGNIFIPQ